MIQIPEAVYFYCTLFVCDPGLPDNLIQVAARQGSALIDKEVKQKDGSFTLAHVPWSAVWLLRRDQAEGPSRSTLGGGLLRSIKTSAIDGQQEEDITVTVFS